MIWKTLNDLKKGHRVLLRNGWEADLMDNKRGGDTRLAKVYGFETEIGSVYSSDIYMYKDDRNSWQPIGLTEKQIKNAQARKALG